MLQFNIFSKDMCLGKNPFCRFSCAALRAVRKNRQQDENSEFRKIQNFRPHVPLALKGLRPFKPVKAGRYFNINYDYMGGMFSGAPREWEGDFA